MGILTWLRGTNTREASDHSIGSTYSFLFDPSPVGGSVYDGQGLVVL